MWRCECPLNENEDILDWSSLNQLLGIWCLSLQSSGRTWNFTGYWMLDAGCCSPASIFDKWLANYFCCISLYLFYADSLGLVSLSENGVEKRRKQFRADFFLVMAKWKSSWKCSKSMILWHKVLLPTFIRSTVEWRDKNQI